MVRWIESLVRLMPVQHVAGLLGLHGHTVKAIDHRRLNREVVESDRSQLTRLIMDEFALIKGHRYATAVITADNQQVLGFAPSEQEARQRWQDWFNLAISSGLEPV